MLDETHLGTVFSEAINVPLEPGEDIRDARIEAAGADDDWTRRHVGQRLAIKVVALHQARLLIGSDRKPSVVHSQGRRDALAQKIGVRLA